MLSSWRFVNITYFSNKCITKIINNQLDIKLGEFIQAELDIILTKMKKRKAGGLDEIPPEISKTRNSMTYCFDTVTSFITRI